MTLRIVNPRIEYLANPVGIEVEQPRFSWVLESEQSNQWQTSYQIRVWNAQDETIWDTGKVPSAAQNQISYAGSPVPSTTRVWWSVRVWNQDGEVSEWVTPQFWETGLLDEHEWDANWISYPDLQPYAELPETRELDQLLPAAHLRKSFDVPSKVSSARLYATARGVYEPWLNGTRIGDHVLAPGWTDYLRRIQYQTWDVTDLIQPGANTLAGLLGTGWFSGYVGWKEQSRLYGKQPSLLMKLVMQFEDGSQQVVTTDGSWEASIGAIRYSDMQMGEYQDARCALTSFSVPGSDEGTWVPVQSDGFGYVHLVADRSEPVRALELIPTVARTEPAPGVYVFDIGQNIAGWAKLRAEGAAGTTIRLRFAEILNPDGTIYTENLRDARATDTFVLAGNGVEEFTPHFTFHGFRYVEVTGYPGEPPMDAISAQFVGSDTTPVSSFACSDELTNQLYRNIVWGQRGNFLSVPTDCPQRDERLGWLGDAQVFVGTATCNMDVASFFTKWMVDVEDAQSEEGAYSNVAPRAVDAWDSAPAWADCGVIVPWTIWQRYGDTSIINRHWHSMTKWMQYLLQWNPDYIWRHRRGRDFGDWLSIEADTDKELIGSAYLAYDAKLLAQMAKATGRNAEAAHYYALYRDAARAFQQEYVGADGSIRGETQTAYCLALHFDLIDADLRPLLSERLVANIREKDTHLSTGFVGVSYLCHVLTANGRSDVAWGLLHQQGYPGWKYSILHGATTIWERWDGWTEHKGFQTPTMNSFNHYSLGSVGEWVFGSALGIGQVAGSTGFSHLRIKPEVDASLDFAEGTYDSIRGTIRTRWERTGGQVRLQATVPVNTRAEIWAGDRFESVGSGTWEFSWPE